MFSIVRKLTRKFCAPTKSKSAGPKKGQMPGGFEQLEDRTCPDITWTGAAGDAFWSTARNWDDNGVMRVPVANEVIKFDAGTPISKMDMQFATPIQCIDINGFGGNLIFQKDVSVKVLELRDPNAWISGSKTVTVLNFMTWKDGGIGSGDHGTLLLASGCVTDVNNGVGAGPNFAAVLDGWKIQNEGEFDWNGGGTISLTHQAKIENWASGVVNLGPNNITNPPFTIRRVDATDQVSFSNDGTVEATSSGVFTISTDIFSCAGTWNLSGDTNFLGNTNFGSANVTVAAGKYLVLGGASTNFQFSFSSTTISGPGTLDLASGAYSIADNLNVVNARQLNGTIDGSGNITISGTFEYKEGLWRGFGTMEVLSNASLLFSFNDPIGTSIQRSINNHGALTVNSPTNVDFAQGANIDNRMDGTVTFTVVHFTSSGGKLTNYGGIINYNAPRPSKMKLDYVSKPGSIWNNHSGFLQGSNATIEGGEFRMGGAEVVFDTSFVLTGGLLTGSGNLTAQTVSNNGGSISIADSLSSAPLTTLTINGTFQQQSGSLNLRIGNNGLNDQLIVNGPATIGGTLSLSAIFGSTFAPGDSWVLLESSQPISGIFASVSAPAGIVIDYLTDPRKVIARAS